ncbi:MAG: UDP-N-acetylglucosamine--N-acetylmuramyl-(pentapeptide) pyrophosphoryl-undecaprenol N-acetylglucosamine transferase [Proteobacteria bacterium]|nr:UDP-N-acetylglucosamine--N-acetylmuramyl-(pentapeptide) pyrophosphoryl-undecaprenol N-acetylglucosamine transferase [Pseudomonadota bacterium]
MRIFFSTGGSGGHIMPAVSVIESAIKKQHDCFLILDKRGKKILDLANSESIQHTKIKVLNTKSFSGTALQKIFALFTMCIAIIQSIVFLLIHRPNVVIGFGCYASLPSLIAATLLGVPIILHEQNTFMGRVNKLMSRFSTQIGISFPETKGIPKHSEHKVFHSGLSIRHSITDKVKNEPNQSIEPQSYNKSTMSIFVLGGSQGSSILSKIAPLAIISAANTMNLKITVYHQARSEHIEDVQNIYEKSGIKCHIQSFFSNIDEIYKQSNLVISRAGATSIAEIIHYNIRSILVPLKNSKDNHQYHNALYLATHYKSILIEEKDFTQHQLEKNIYKILEDPRHQNASVDSIIDTEDSLLNAAIKYSM